MDHFPHGIRYSRNFSQIAAYAFLSPGPLFSVARSSVLRPPQTSLNVFFFLSQPSSSPYPAFVFLTVSPKNNPASLSSSYQWVFFSFLMTFHCIPHHILSSCFNGRKNQAPSTSGHDCDEHSKSCPNITGNGEGHVYHLVPSFYYPLQGLPCSSPYNPSYLLFFIH